MTSDKAGQRAGASNLLQAQGLCVQTTATVGVDLAVQAGSCWGIWGGAGSGKTALLRTLARLERPVGGTLLGSAYEKVAGLGWESRRRGVVLVLATPYTALEPWRTVGRLLGAKESQRAAALRRAGLSPVLMSYPVRALSGVERMRLLFARAWLSGPRVVLVDDASWQLPLTAWQRLITDWQLALGEERALVVVGRRPETLGGAENVVVLCRGDGVEGGPRAAVVETPVHPYTCWLRAHPDESLPAGSGCGFSQVCPAVRPACREALPAPVEVAPGHWVRCHQESDT